MAALGIGVTVKTLAGKVYFNDWRALPGMTMTLTLETDTPENKHVDIIARTKEGSRHIQTLQGAPTLEVEIPFIETADESYELIALVYDWQLASLESEPVEVLVQSYRFGL